jgi:hypothetical protein
MMSKEEARATVNRPVWLKRYKWFCPDLETLKKKIIQFATAKLDPEKYAYTMKFTIPDEDIKFFTRLNAHEYMLDRRVSQNVHFLSVQPFHDQAAIYRVASRYLKRAATYTVNVGDPVLYGKWKNHHGVITDLSTDHKGNPTVTVTPVPQGRKQPKEMQLFKIWQDPPPALQAPTEPTPRVAGSKRTYPGLKGKGCLILSRVGGLSPVKQKNTSAPAKKGLWAFMWPWIDTFLLGSTNDRGISKEDSITRGQQLKTEGLRKFKYCGYLWTHFDVPGKMVARKGMWNLVHSGDLATVAPRAYQYNLKDARQEYYNRLTEASKLDPNLKEYHRIRSMAEAQWAVRHADWSEMCEVFVEPHLEDQKTASSDLEAELHLSPGKWEEVSPSHRDFDEKTQLWNLYHVSYGVIGESLPSLAVLTSKYKFLWVIDTDGDQNIDAFIAYNWTHAGRKIAVLASDGSSAAKRASILRCMSLLKQKGWYAEMSRRPAELAERAGIPKIMDEATVRATLRKNIEWLGEGNYRRSISGIGDQVKSLYGHPQVRRETK